MRYPRYSILGLLGILAAASPTHAQYSWTGQNCMEGDWTVAICWCDDCVDYPDDPLDGASIFQGEPTIGGTINLLSLTTQQAGSVLISGNLNYWGSALTNSGQIRLLGGRILPLTSEPFFTLAGPGRLILDGAGPAQGANIPSLSTTVLINAQSHTIQGRGVLTIPMMNPGTINATGDLRIGLFNLDNAGGLLKSSAAAARLRIDRITCTGGLLQADAGVINLVGATLRNATLRPGDGELTIGDHVFQNYTASSSFDTVTLNGNSRILLLGELNLSTPCTNNGVMHIDGGGQLRLILPGGALVGSGAVLLEPGPDPVGGGTLRGNGRGQAEGHTIHGSGTISYGLENYGVILADLPGKHLLITTAIGQPPSQYSNRGGGAGTGGLIGASAGGVLRIEYCNVTQMFGGMIRASDPGSSVTTSYSTIDGGTITAAGGGQIRALGPNSWGHGLRVQADVTVLPGTLSFFGVPIANLSSATIDGQITIAGTEAPITSAIVELPPDGLLEGTGSLRLAAPSEVSLSASRIVQYDGASTIGPGITIHGSGQFIPSNTTVQGLVRAEGIGRSLVISSGAAPLVNTGVLAASSGASLVIQARPVQSTGGRIEPSGGRVRLDGAAITGGLLQGLGSLDSAPGFISSLTGLQNQGTILVRGGSTLIVNGPMQNDGLILVNPDGSSDQTFLRLNGTRAFTGAGEVRLLSSNPTDGLQLLGNVVSNDVNHTIRGPGRILGGVDNSGRLSTTPPSVSLTSWPIDGPLTLRAPSRLHVDLAGTLVSRITVTSTATLSGQLEVAQTLPGSLPVGSTLTLLSASSVSGTFTSTIFPSAASGQRYSVVYTPTSVLLRLSRAADFNGDNVLSVQDIFDFLNAWFSGSLAADFNGSGALSVQDIFDFLTAWFVG